MSGKSRLVKGGVRTGKQLFDAACSLFSGFWRDKRIRLVSVAVYGLRDNGAEGVPLTLFGDPPERPERRQVTAREIAADINDRFGFEIIKRASEL